MRNIKNYLLSFILGGIIFSGVTVFAEYIVTADKIEYAPNISVKDKIDNLYTTVTQTLSNKDQQISMLTPKKICKLKNETYGQKNQIGSMYECDLGSGVKKNFYILAVNNEKVDMIMQRNITEATNNTIMTWNNAMKYIKNNNLKTAWSNVLDVDLPKAQDIANAVGRNNWYAGDNDNWWCLETKQIDTTVSPYCYNNTKKTSWLWDYTRECNNCDHSLGSTEAYGYWTRDVISNTANAWYVYGLGALSFSPVSDSSIIGVRPVITVLKSNLYEVEE